MALFPPGKGGGDKVDYGYKGKGILIHLLVDQKGMPLSFTTTCAKGSERGEVSKLVEKVNVKTGKPGRPPKKVKKVAMDKGYDSEPLRQAVREMGIQPQIPRKKNAKPRRGRPTEMTAPRFQVERSFSWLDRKFRRLAVRWERISYCYDAYLLLGIIMIWMQKLVG